MAVGEVVIIKNVGSVDFVGKHASIKYTIPAGGQRIVPWEAMCLWMGNPEAVDKENSPARTDEYRRLRFKYGIYHNMHLAAERFPKLEAYDLDDNRLITVIDDPEGAHLTPEVNTRAENEILRERLARMEREMIALRRQANMQERVDAAESMGIQVTEDAAPGETPQAPDAHQIVKARRQPDLPNVVTEDTPTQVGVE
ncbi:MAG: hypothetical protein KatS3mg015_2932 [Fimbriimonadales bacterium]|nr:MAG: hypothetical protein KatS3mg015_2932 [Fimbriimonadales bacterium]